MITPHEIAIQLQETLPLLTDQFHDSIPVTSGSVSSGILTITFPDPHLMVPGDQIYINEAIIRNAITGVVENADGTVSYTTAEEHDLTSYTSYGHGNTWPQGLSVQIEEDGVDKTVNLVNDPSGVPHENEFSGVKGSPIFVPDGDDYLLENRAIGVIGFKEIQATPTDTTIEINLSDVPSIPDGPIIISEVLTNIRVSHVADIQRAEEMYTKQNSYKAWLFIIMLDREPSKNRNNYDDFTGISSNGTLKELDIRQEFSTVCFYPCSDDLGAGVSKTWTYNDLFTILIKCLHGWKQTGYNGDGQSVYNTAFLSQAYEWQARSRIDFTDGYTNSKTVALRRLEFTQTIFDEGESSGEIQYP